MSISKPTPILIHSFGLPSDLYEAFWVSLVSFRKDPTLVNQSELSILESCVRAFLQHAFYGPQAQALPVSQVLSDWEYLVSSPFHHNQLQSDQPWLKSLALPSIDENAREPFPYLPLSVELQANSLLLTQFVNCLPSFLVCLHLVYEDCRLSLLKHDDCSLLASFLMQLAALLNSKSYQDYYVRNGASLALSLNGSLSEFIQGSHSLSKLLSTQTF